MDITSKVQILESPREVSAFMALMFQEGRYAGDGVTNLSAGHAKLAKGTVFLLKPQPEHLIYVKVIEDAEFDYLGNYFAWVDALIAPDGTSPVILLGADAAVPAGATRFAVANAGGTNIFDDEALNVGGKGGIYDGSGVLAGNVDVDLGGNQLQFAGDENFNSTFVLIDQFYQWVCGNGSEQLTVTIQPTSIQFFLDPSSPQFRINELPAFDDAAAAVSGGVPTGGLWKASGTNTMGVPEGTVLVRDI